MKPSSMKICALLLWGVCVCVLLAEEPVTSSAPDNSNTNITAPTDVTTSHQVTAHKSVLKPATSHPTEPADITAEQEVLPTTVPEVGIRNKTNSSAGGRLELTTVEPATSSFRLLTPTEKVTAKEVVPVKTTAATEQTLPVVFMTTDRPQSVSPTITATVTTASGGAASSSATTTAAGKEQVFSSKTTVDVQTSTQITSTGSGLQPSTALTTATSEAQPSNFTTMADAVNQTTEHLYTSSFTNMTASTSSHVSTQHSTSITGSKTEVPFTTSLGKSTQSTAVPTSGTFRSTGTELSSPSYSVPATTTFNSTPTGPVSTSTESSNTTTANFSSPAGVFNHSRVSTTSWAPSTTKSPCEASKGSSSNEVLPCSTRGVVKQCLIIIAVLALVATIFIVSTIILCIKLSARKYKVRKPQQATEMMCISSLLPDRSITYMRQRNPVSNGVLVFPGGGESDEEGGDNLTLSSFLPENDPYV